jgi:acetyl esterase/lipase
MPPEQHSQRGRTTLAIAIVAAVSLVAVAGCSTSTKVAIPTTTTTTFPDVSVPSNNGPTSTTQLPHRRGGPACIVPGAPFANPTTAAASSVREYRNRQYGPAAKEQLDVFEPTSVSGTMPAVLTVHGGGYIAGGRPEVKQTAEDIAAAGFVVFNADYTLAAPGAPGYPNQVNELEAAVQWIRANAAQYHVDPTRIGAFGGSAGGTLVALLASVPTGPCTSGGRVAAVVSLSGPMDLQTLDHTPSLCSSGSCKAINYQGIDEFVGCQSPETCPDAKLLAASPVSHIDGSTAPMYVFNSTTEVIPADQAQGAADALTSAAVPHDLTIEQGTGHSFSYITAAIGPSIAFLKKWLG